MMDLIYKLYVNIAGWSQLDLDFDKKSIIDTMVCDNKMYKHTYYMIVAEDNEIPPMIAPECTTLRSQEEIDEYVKSYNQEKLSSMSCVDLKREILKRKALKK